MKTSRTRMFLESFIPVVAIIACLIAVLFYVQFKAAFEATRVTVIAIEDPAARSDTGYADEEQDAAPEVSATESQDPRFQEAARLTTEKKWGEAEQKYREILAAGVTSQALNDLGVLYYRKRDLRRAIEHFDRAVKAQPVYPPAIFNRGLVLSATGRYAEAIRDYEVFTGLMPNHFEARYNTGLALLRLKEFEKAAAVLEQASRLANGVRKAKALYGLGTAQRGIGPEMKEQARKSFEQAIRLKPDFIEPRFGLALLEPQTAAGKKRALIQYDLIFKLKPNYPPAFFNLGLLQSALGDARAAEEAYRTAVQFDPEHTKARYNLGLLLLSSKQFAEARSEFETILKREPGHAESRFNLGRAAYGQKDYSAAMQEYRKAVELRKGSYPEAYLNMGLVAAAQKQYAEATTSWRKAISVRKEYPDAWFNLGLAHLRQLQ